MNIVNRRPIDLGQWCPVGRCIPLLWECQGHWWTANHCFRGSRREWGCCCQNLDDECDRLVAGRLIKINRKTTIKTGRLSYNANRKTIPSSGGWARGEPHYVADPGIRHGEKINMFTSILRLFPCSRGAKVYSQTGSGGHGRICSL